MTFRFSNSKDSRKNYIRLVLKTEDPFLYRCGDVRDYPDVDTETIESTLSAFLDEEQNLARTFGQRIKEDDCRTALAKRIQEYRMDARDLFIQMESCEDDSELCAINSAFSGLTREARMIERAFTIENPWYVHYNGLDDIMKAVELVVVKASITDPAWFDHPRYPEDKNYARFGMKGAKAKVETEKTVTGRGTQNGKMGRPGKKAAPDYIEPSLRILSYEPVGFFREYRAMLPQSWTMHSGKQASGRNSQSCDCPDKQ